VTTFGLRPPRVRGIRIHHSCRTQPGDFTDVEGIPATTPTRTVADLAAVLDPFRLERALDEALIRRLTTLPRLRAALAARPGARGCAVLRTLLDRRDPAIERADSPLEHRVLRTLLAAGVPRPVAQHPVRVGAHRFVLDLAWPAQHVAVEVDGWAAHGSRRMFDRDRHKSNLLQQAGWMVLRYTSSTPDEEVVAQVRLALSLPNTRSVLP
jgi:very-short-patch-repair endonuclease